ncbi:hypothetical protein [Streptomyces sp. NBC_01565]|uniref:hypothetical protein n=1 Tax=unclassified Streptomyces TaxID=2593676 RepID=UPI0022506EC8|nr:hypothetical protein [Streptomyces sp. NBC_01565]MCX4545805.1 hypothetical protein [Streptomyces sp. NBC_01565]
MTTTTKTRAGLTTALLLLTALTSVGPAAASPTSASAERVGETSASARDVRLIGHWSEPVDKYRPGITHYIEKLTFTADGRFEQINNYVCNQKNCPVFKIGLNKGTYRTDGNTIRLDGNLADLTGTVKATDTITIDGHALHRVDDQD